MTRTSRLYSVSLSQKSWPWLVAFQAVQSIHQLFPTISQDVDHKIILFLGVKWPLFVFVLQFKLVTATSFHPIPCFIACIRIFARKVLFLVEQNSSFPAKSSGFFRFYGEKCSGAFFLTSAACCFLRSA